jgi:hypothetical protein
VLYDYTWRLAGVRRQNDELHWNVRPDCPCSKNASFRTRLNRSGAIAELQYHPRTAELTINNRPVAQLNGCARLITDLDGTPRSLLGTSTTVTTLSFRLPGHQWRHVTLAPNERKSLT